MSMTIDEAKRCIKDDVFPALPDVADWMLTKSPQPERTLDLWAKALTRVDRNEVQRVIDLWFIGTVQAPKAYERELIPQCLVSNAMHLRATDASKRATAANKEAAVARLETPRVMDAVRAHELWPRWLKLQESVDLAEMTELDAIREWNQILDAAFASGRVRFTL
jgi:hypothetical protein